jgi:hypothetical protein
VLPGGKLGPVSLLRRKPHDTKREDEAREASAAAHAKGLRARVPPPHSQVVASFVAQAEHLGEEARPRLNGMRSRLAHIDALDTDDRRAWLCVDWLVRDHAPAWLDLAGLGRRARALRRLEPLTGPSAARDAVETLENARVDAGGAAAREAAWDATWAQRWEVATTAARDAAWAGAAGAAWQAARDGARFADWEPVKRALGDAPWDAARAAAWDAAWEAGDEGQHEAAHAALAETASEVELSALDLLARLLDPNLDPIR